MAFCCRQSICALAVAALPSRSQALTAPSTRPLLSTCPGRFQGAPDAHAGETAAAQVPHCTTNNSPALPCCAVPSSLSPDGLRLALQVLLLHLDGLLLLEHSRGHVGGGHVPHVGAGSNLGSGGRGENTCRHGRGQMGWRRAAAGRQAGHATAAAALASKNRSPHASALRRRAASTAPRVQRPPTCMARSLTKRAAATSTRRRLKKQATPNPAQPSI